MQSLFGLDPLGILAVLGGIWATTRLYHLASFVHLHFLHRGRLHRYKQSTDSALGSSWALVTGASDGIGKGFAEELCEQGFNVILHGRNVAKLETVRAALLKLWPERQIELLVLDAATAVDDPTTLAAAAERLSHLNLRIIINNVAGGLDTLWTPLAKRTPSEITRCLAVTAHFPTQLTCAFLPALLKRQPALIVNVGSGVGELPAPYIAVYAGAKAYNHAFSRCLATEMRAEGHDVEVLGLLVGMVATHSAPRATSPLVPSARVFARSALRMVGCGRSVVWAYWPHALQFGGLVMNLPRWILEMAVIGIARKEKAIEEAEAKER